MFSISPASVRARAGLWTPRDPQQRALFDLDRVRFSQFALAFGDHLAFVLRFLAVGRAAEPDFVAVVGNVPDVGGDPHLAAGDVFVGDRFKPLLFADFNLAAFSEPFGDFDHDLLAGGADDVDAAVGVEFVLAAVEGDRRGKAERLALAVGRGDLQPFGGFRQGAVVFGRFAFHRRR